MRLFFEQVATDRDIAAVADLGRIIWTEHYTPIIGPEQVEYMLEKFQSAPAIREQLAQGYVYRKAEADGRLAGYSSVRPEDGGGLFLSKLYIHKDLRGMGIGRRLFEESVRPFAGKDGLTVRLTVNKYNAGSIAAYKKLGFAIVDEVVADIGQGYVMDDYIMECRVAGGG